MSTHHGSNSGKCGIIAVLQAEMGGVEAAQVVGNHLQVKVVLPPPPPLCVCVCVCVCKCVCVCVSVCVCV